MPGAESTMVPSRSSSTTGASRKAPEMVVVMQVILRAHALSTRPSTWASGSPRVRWGHDLHTRAAPPRRERLERQEPVHRLGRRSEEHTSELQSRGQLVCRLLLVKKKRLMLGWVRVLMHG